MLHMDLVERLDLHNVADDKQMRDQLDAQLQQRSVDIGKIKSGEKPALVIISNSRRPAMLVPCSDAFLFKDCAYVLDAGTPSVALIYFAVAKTRMKRQQGLCPRTAQHAARQWCQGRRPCQPHQAQGPRRRRRRRLCERRRRARGGPFLCCHQGRREASQRADGKLSHHAVFSRLKSAPSSLFFVFSNCKSQQRSVRVFRVIDSRDSRKQVRLMFDSDDTLPSKSVRISLFA